MIFFTIRVPFGRLRKDSPKQDALLHRSHEQVVREIAYVKVAQGKYLDIDKQSVALGQAQAVRSRTCVFIADGLVRR